jgi:hypothetical protein
LLGLCWRIYELSEYACHHLFLGYVQAVVVQDHLRRCGPTPILLTLTALLLWRCEELKFSAHNSGSKIVWPQLLHVGTPKTWQ